MHSAKGGLFLALFIKNTLVPSSFHDETKVISWLWNAKACALDCSPTAILHTGQPVQLASGCETLNIKSTCRVAQSSKVETEREGGREGETE